MFTLALPNVRAISATVPGRFSIEIVNCLVLAMLGPPMAFGWELYACGRWERLRRVDGNNFDR
jgi:hypothetical protein